MGIVVNLRYKGTNGAAKRFKPGFYPIENYK